MLVLIYLDINIDPSHILFIVNSTLLMVTKAAHSNSKKDDSETAHENDSTETYSIDESGHVFGNFPSYYRFNLVSERLRFLNQDTIQALRNYLFRIPEQDAGRPAFLLDVGCNEGSTISTAFNRPVT